MEQLNNFIGYIENILNYFGIDIDKVITKGIQIVIIIAIMYFSIKLGNQIIKKFVERQSKNNDMFSVMDEKKAMTIGSVMSNGLKYTVYFIGGVALLSLFVGKISLTFAGIGGVAVGFGAQSFVKDLINGFFILFEGQYSIGDYVTIGGNSGIVESFGIRTTALRDQSGALHLIPNGNITEVTNFSRGSITVIVDTEIAYEESIDDAIKVINLACEKVTEQNEDIVESPKVVGVTSLNASSVTIRVIGKAKPMTQWQVERDIRKAIKIELDNNEIEIPYPKTQIINK